MKRRNEMRQRRTESRTTSRVEALALRVVLRRLAAVFASASCKMAASLEELISSKMAALGLSTDEDSCAFVLSMVEEDSFELEVLEISKIGGGWLTLGRNF